MAFCEGKNTYYSVLVDQVQRNRIQSIVSDVINVICNLSKPSGGGLCGLNRNKSQRPKFKDRDTSSNQAREVIKVQEVLID